MNSVLFALASSFVFVVVVNTQAQTRPERNGVFISALAECKAKLSPTADDEKMMIMRERLTTRGSQCLSACVKKKVEIMGSDNKMNIEKAAELMAPLKSFNPDMFEKIMVIMKECKAKETTEADECVAAKKFSDCVVDKKDAVSGRKNMAGLPK